MKRVYHPYHLWEDWQAGMWTPVNGVRKQELLEKAIEFTGNHRLYGSWMLKAVRVWPISCEHNLTCTTMNRLAWIGHAATFLAIQCPEMITREAWGRLTQEQRDLANGQAREALTTWRIGYAGENLLLGAFLGAEGIPERNT